MPNARAPPTSCSSASPARRRSRRSSTARTACWRPRAPGLVVVDTSTAEPASSAKIRADLAAQGVKLIDAPLARTPKEAEEGRLNTMVGAEPEDFKALEPVLKAFCENIFHVGPARPRPCAQAGEQHDGHELRGVASPKPSPSAPRRGCDLNKLYHVISAGGVELRHLPDDGHRAC